ncbi:hypothetical protein PGT21_028394 [Puccinia graminis f. sp. tritici]|uniref:Uncharacterized protein n=1 Tax=Puccinia graminis f. sp. tritici TaxID=56615 RepID=A0A5B0NHJ1_PUCGR|nr:hypothetical protein PGT21_028394 [Puccinia graminis f. sp. tritici]
MMLTKLLRTCKGKIEKLGEVSPKLTNKVVSEKKAVVCSKLTSALAEPKFIRSSDNKKMETLLLKCLGISFQERLCQTWRDGGLWCMTKYKSVAKKIRPINEAIPQALNPPLQRPALSRDPYETPLTPNPPEFVPTEKVTEERLKMVNFGPEGWLSSEELKLFKNLIVIREKAIGA